MGTGYACVQALCWGFCDTLNLVPGMYTQIGPPSQWHIPGKGFFFSMEGLTYMGFNNSEGTEPSTYGLVNILLSLSYGGRRNQEQKQDIIWLKEP